MREQKTPNRLANEKSPYLLQHSYNPVDWWPWCDEAFAKAKAEDKPVFLSIGYSTCHWCHVMERESFEDEEVAASLNAGFIAIKVDREERPDIDAVYMNVCMAITGGGGWPLTVFMDADKQPFFAGTYLPKRSHTHMNGLMELLSQIELLWVHERERLCASAKTIVEAVSAQHEASGELHTATLDKALSQLTTMFDKRYGGFGKAPKFPTPHNLMLLMRLSEASPSALDMAVKTLDAMLKGGIHDHIGSGFCRYSTDEKFLAPHFEKMLYDNALLIIAFAECYGISKQPRHRRAVEDVITFVMRELSAPEGGFYCALDADSEGEEGKFYLWTPDEVVDVLGEARAREFCERYDITERGNFEGSNIPNLIEAGLDVDTLDESRALLLAARERRVRPFRDGKLLTSWNGLMIAALSIAGRAFENDGYIEAAKRAATFITEHMVVDGELMARYADGEVRNAAFSEDYACLCFGLTELYLAGFEERYLRLAQELMDEFIANFWDEPGYGFFLSSRKAERLIMNPKEIYDGAMPSANSLSAYNLVRLSHLVGEPRYMELATSLLNGFAKEIEASPVGHTLALMALWLMEAEAIDVVITARTDVEAREFLCTIAGRFRPNVLPVLFTTEHQGLSDIAPYLKAYDLQHEGARAYVCVGSACRPPVDTARELLELL